MTSPYEAMCAELVQQWDTASSDRGLEQHDLLDVAEAIVDRVRALLDQSEPMDLNVDDILTLASIIREVDGNNRSGAARLAEDILGHPSCRWGRPAPQSEPEEPTDNKLMDIARATDLVYYMGKGCGFASPYMEETDITAEVLAFSRAVLARYGGSTSSSINA